MIHNMPAQLKLFADLTAPKCSSRQAVFSWWQKGILVLSTQTSKLPFPVFAFYHGRFLFQMFSFSQLCAPYQVNSQLDNANLICLWKAHKKFTLFMIKLKNQETIILYKQLEKYIHQRCSKMLFLVLKVLLISLLTLVKADDRLRKRTDASSQVRIFPYYLLSLILWLLEIPLNSACTLSFPWFLKQMKKLIGSDVEDFYSVVSV